MFPCSHIANTHQDENDSVDIDALLGETLGSGSPGIQMQMQAEAKAKAGLPSD